MAHFITHSTSVRRGMFVHKFQAFLKAFVKHRSNRATYARMMEMSNRDLADVGLTRSDITEAISRSMTRPGA
jgi:uncharacterized protein YjiS (DUF1127 family)